MRKNDMTHYCLHRFKSQDKWFLRIERQKRMQIYKCGQKYKSNGF